MATIDLGAGVAIAGAGIGGLVAALSLDAIGVEVTVFEAVDEIRPAGVGINLLPHSTRELDALGLLERLTARALAPATVGYYAKNGREIWSEPRGVEAGYRWPQLSIHRGELHRILLDTAMSRLGSDRVILGHRLAAVDTRVGGASAVLAGPGGTEVKVSAAAIIAADGIHSAARAQFYPDQGAPKWSGALLWRGIVDREQVSTAVR